MCDFWTFKVIRYGERRALIYYLAIKYKQNNEYVRKLCQYLPFVGKRVHYSQHLPFGGEQVHYDYSVKPGLLKSCNSRNIRGTGLGRDGCFCKVV